MLISFMPSHAGKSRKGFPVRFSLLALLMVPFLSCSTTPLPKHEKGSMNTSIPANPPSTEHGLHYTTPAMSWDEALPLGNGILGALVWGDGDPVRVSLDRTDLWDLRPVPEFRSPECTFQRLQQWRKEGRIDDIKRLYDAPYSRPESPTKIPAGRLELAFREKPEFKDAVLDISDAVASMSFTNGIRLQVCVLATEPVGFIRCSANAGASVRLVAPPFGEQDASSGSLHKLGYPSPAISSGTNWQAFTQQGAEGFHFAVYVAWRETGDTSLFAWSVASSFEGRDPLRIARERVETAMRRGFDRMYTSHAEWWRDYWAKSSICLPDKTIERQWFLEQYKFGAASRRGCPPITLQGPWTADNADLPPWKGDYHHDLNTQLSYWPCYSANHLEEGLAYLEWLWRTRDNCRDWTWRFFGMPGLNVPGVADLNNSPMGGWCMYSFSTTTAAWLAHHFYQHWRYSGDAEFLRDRAYPYLKDAAVFIEAVSAGRDASGKRTLPLSASPEINDNRLDAWFDTMTNYDLALVRWLLGAAAEMADALQLPAEASRWRQVSSEMPDFALGDDGRLLIAKDYPLPASHRHFSHLMAVHPLGLIDWEDGPRAQRTIRAALDELDRLGPDYWCGYSYAWLANLAARARDGECAARALGIFCEAFCLRNSFHCNGDQSGKGYSKLTYRPFTLEGNFAAAAGIQEMLLQSHRGRIRVFPAVPDHWQDVAFTSLRAEGAFLVSAKRANGVTQRLEIFAEQGGPCRVLSPFSGKEILLELKKGERIVLTQDPPDAGGAM